MAGGRVTRTRHPIAMHHFEGRVICHLCLNQLLEMRSQTLYSKRRTWIA
jgi:hypothetical protein